MHNPIKRTDFRIKFLGNSADKIADNMFLLDINKCKILLDCGLYQEPSNDLTVYQTNKRPLQFKYNAIDYIILSGYELENCGLLPRLFQQGCTARVCVPTGCRKLLIDMMYKNVELAQKQVDVFNKKVNNKKVCDYLPLFTEKDVKKIIPRIFEYRYGKCYELQEGVKFTYYYSGYAIGTAQILVELTVKDATRTIGYTGNIGSTISGNFVRPRENLPPCDVLIGETTRCDIFAVATKPRTDNLLLKRTIDDVCRTKGKRLLLVCPSVSSVQVLLSTIYEIYRRDLKFKIPIIVDMTFGEKANEHCDKLIQKDVKLWNRLKVWDNITWVKTQLQTKGQLRSSKPKIIITSIDPEELDKGYVWMEKILKEEEACVGFCGCEESPVLKQLKNKKKFSLVKVLNRPFKFVSKINWFNSFNRHADREELLNYYTGIGCDQIFLVHGDPRDKKDFISQLKVKLSWAGRKTEVINPEIEFVYYIK